MKKKLRAYRYESGQHTIVEFEPAKICPMCHTSFNGEVISNCIISKTDYMGRDTEILFIMHYCSSCETCFLGIYPKQLNTLDKFTLSTAVPAEHQEAVFEECIQKLSSRFVSIYNEAMFAEKENFLDICGFGYRRALEVLIKDFCIEMHPDEKETITKMFLGKCIENYITYPKLKEVAKRAVWLGNDHAHYERVHTDKDLQDLKLLVNLSVHWVAIELQTREAESIQYISKQSL